MTATVTVDLAGRLVLPKAMRDRLHLSAGSKLRAQVIADKIELTPELDAQTRLERRGKLLVLVGGPAFDAADAVRGAREDHDERLRGKTGDRA